MPVIAAQMEIKMVSNVSADSAVNTLHFAQGNAVDALADAETAMFSLYDDLNPLYSSDVAQTGHVLKLYNLDDPQPRAPAVEVTYDFPSNPSIDPLPHQIAICMSYQADRLSGVAQASRRGRIYIGPLDQNRVTSGGRVAPGTITVVNDAAQGIVSTLSSTGTSWVVYSPTTGFDAAVTNGWCDDTFDIQRRRQRDAVTRNVWP